MDGHLGGSLNAGNLLTDLAGRLRSLLGKCFDLGSHDRKATACLACTRSLDGRVQRQKIGLAGDRVDQFDDIADASGRFGQFADTVIGRPGLLDRFGCHPS